VNTSINAHVTRFPVEVGVDITDHIQPEARTLRLDCFVSTHPTQRLLSIANSLAGRFLTTNIGGQGAAVFGALLRGGITSIANQGVSSEGPTGPNLMKLLGDRNAFDPEYPKKVMQGLTQLLESGVLLNIKTYMSKTLYTKMAITSLTYNNEPTTGESLNFTMGLKRIRTVADVFTSVAELRSLAAGARGVAPQGQAIAADIDPPDSIGTSAPWVQQTVLR